VRAVTALQQKVKNALDEARILVIGCQVLLGFQFRAFFEPQFEKVSPWERNLCLVGLFLLLGVLLLLLLPAARHRVVERGRDSASFHRFTMLVMRVALLPFAAALGLDLSLAGNRILGLGGGIACGVAAGLFTLTFWYGMFFHPGRKRHHQPEDDVAQTPLEHRVVQVLTEARVVLPGAQALLGFQFAMVLMDGFEKLDPGVKQVHLAALGCIALATIVLMAPAAYHRIVERGEDSERFHDFAGRMVLLALALLAPGFAGDVYVVLRKLRYDQAATVSVATVLVFYGVWFGLTSLLKALRKDEGPGNAPRPSR
jgi:hypothetical protein